MSSRTLKIKLGKIFLINVIITSIIIIKNFIILFVKVDKYIFYINFYNKLVK